MDMPLLRAAPLIKEMPKIETPELLPGVLTPAGTRETLWVLVDHDLRFMMTMATMPRRGDGWLPSSIAVPRTAS
jgi:hypothetical protein